MLYRRALSSDLRDVCRFTDWWISGRGKAKHVPGAVNDCFISRRQHAKYILKYETWLCVEGDELIAWAVIEPSGTLIHLLVAGDQRGRGIGKRFIDGLRPRYVRSKLDQSTGNPIEFYMKMGYKKVDTVRSKSRFDIDRLRPDRMKNIDILVRGNEGVRTFDRFRGPALGQELGHQHEGGN